MWIDLKIAVNWTDHMVTTNKRSLKDQKNIFEPSWISKSLRYPPQKKRTEEQTFNPKKHNLHDNSGN